MSGPLPTHFRWLWYLVGLAGMVLAVVGILAMLGSALDTGILVPFVVVVVVVIGGGVMWFRRSLDAAVAAAPSRQAGPARDGETESIAPEPEPPTHAGASKRATSRRGR